MFNAIPFAEATTTQDQVAFKFIASKSMTLTFDITSVEDICHYCLFLFVHVTVFEVTRNWLMRTISGVLRLNSFLRLFSVGFDAKYLNVGDI